MTARLVLGLAWQLFVVGAALLAPSFVAGTAAGRESRDLDLEYAAYASLQSGRVDQAEALCAELTDIDPLSGQDSRPMSLARHHAHTLRGLILLDRGQLAAAKQELLASSAVPPTAELNRVGPSMQLASELLRRGERETVLQYIASARRLWFSTAGRTRLDAWASAIKADRIPDFGTQLVYGG